MRNTKPWLSRLWNFEYKPQKSHFIIILALVALIAIAYPIYEVFFNAPTSQPTFTISKYIAATSGETPLPQGPERLRAIFPQLWLGMAFICIAIRIAVIFTSYFQSKKTYGERKFITHFVTYLSSFVIAIIGGLLLLQLSGWLAGAFGFTLHDGKHFFAELTQRTETFISSRVPTLFHYNSYWLALCLAFLFSRLPGYVVHWLCHKSRLCWYVLHRAHHTPEYLHPLAAPPAFVFDFLLMIPSVLVMASISKLFYIRPMFMEASIWFLFGYCLEIFNHAQIHYEFAYRNPIVRNLCRLYGDSGVYHLVHHSAKPNDQMVNLGGGTLQVWDRIFGTYRKPYEKLPEIGLTNSPKIILNPLRIIFSGIAQIAYELWMNKSFKVKFKILFGSVDYKPPISKDFLIVGYSKTTKNIIFA